MPGTGEPFIFTGVKSIRVLFLSMVCMAMIADNTATRPAYVTNQNGVAVYLFCLPDRPFDTVCTFSTDIGLNSYPGPSIPNKVIGFERPIDALVRKAVRMENRGAKKKRKDISAIVSFDAKKATAIRFTTQVKEADVTRALVQQYRGYYLFVQSKPASKYTIQSKVKITSEIDLDFTGYTDVYTMLDSLINRYEKNAGPVKANGLLTTNGIEAEFIELNP